MITCSTLREPTLDDVTRALAVAPFGGWPQDEDELLVLFNILLEAVLIDGRREATSASQASD